MDDLLPSHLVIAQPRATNTIEAWFRRAVDCRDRPLPLLAVEGECGSGKTVLVRQVAKKVGVHLMEPSDPFNAATTAASLHARQLMPTVLFIDDAEALTSEVKGDELIAMAGHYTPVIVAASNYYTTTALRRVRERSKGVERVRIARPSADEVEDLIKDVYPKLEECRHQAIAIESGGDVRRALIDAAMTFGDERHSTTMRERDVRESSSFFDKVHALFGSGSATLPVDDRELGDDVDTCCRMIGVHYINALRPNVSFETLAKCSASLSEADLLSRNSPQTSHALILGGVARRVRVANAHAAASATSRARLSLAGPLGGVGEKRYFEARGRAPIACAAMTRQHFSTLARQRRLVACPRGLSERAFSRLFGAEGALKRLFNDVETCQVLAGHKEPFSNSLRDSLEERTKVYHRTTTSSSLWKAAPKLESGKE